MSQVKRVKPPVLRVHEENEILQYIIEKASKNEKVQRQEVIDFVVKFIQSDNRKNPFRNGTPGDKWFSLFRRRHNNKFLKLEQEQLRILERIGFTEKVMNTVTYKQNYLGKRNLLSLDSSWSPSTPKRKRKPKIFKEFVSSTPNESKINNTPTNLNETAGSSRVNKTPTNQNETSGPSKMNNTSTIQNEISGSIVASSASDESNNINTDDGEKSQESQSDSTDFQPGLKLEVMDFNDDKWYPVKVVEVDYEEGEVLVHFEKWSNRYDEWVRMDSNRIRRPRLPSSNTSKKAFVENEKVIAVWAYNHKYPATVRKVLPNDKYEVLFCDGYAKILRGCKLFKATEEDLKNIQLPPPKKPAPPMGADPLDPDLGPKEERRLKKRRMDVYEALRPHKKNRADNPEPVEVKPEPRSASPSPTRTPTSSKPKESFRVVLKAPRGGMQSEDDSEADDDGWLEDDDSDQDPDNESEQKKKFKKKKKSFDSSDLKHFRSRHVTDEDPERWNMEIPEGALPVQIKDTEGYYRESIIIPDKKLPAGWTKHTMRRKTGAKWDVFLVNEEGRKFRSRNELRNHFAEMNIPFPEENFDFMVGRKMEMIRCQTDGRRKPIDSPGSTVKASPSQKKSDKKSDSKSESTPDQKRVKTMLPKGRSADSGDETKQGHSSADDSVPPLPLALAELRTPDGGYTCCGKSFRKENLFQMHMKHYHPEYSNLFGSTPNVADLAYARTVGEPLEDSRAEAMTPRNSLMERVSKYEADRQKKAAEAEAAQGESSPMSQSKQTKDTSVKSEEDVPKTPKEEVETENENHSEEKRAEEISEQKIPEEKTAPKEQSEDQPKALIEEQKTSQNEEKKTESEEKKTLTNSAVEEETKPPNADTPWSTPPPPSTVAPSTPVVKPVIKSVTKPVTKPVIKPVIKPVKPVISKGGAPAEAVIVQTTSSPKTPVTITKYVPPGQSKPATDSKPLKVTISSDKEGKPTIKTLLPVRPPAPVTASPSASTSSDLQKSKEVKVKEDPEDEVSSASTSKARPRKRTISEPVSKKPKLSKPVTGSLEEDVAAAPEPTPSTSSGSGSGSGSGPGSGLGYRYSRNRTQVPRVALEKLNVSQDSSGRVVVAPVEETDKTQNTEGRRQFKKFKSTNNISRKSKGGKSGEESAAKTEPIEELATDGAAAAVAPVAAANDSEVYENLRKEEIINCTCGFTEEDGLMIQCDLCLCWQHGYCNNINKESEVPEKYVCYICLHPARQRESMRHCHNQDWLKEGKLPSFSFSQKDPEVIDQRQKMLKKSHDLSASVLQLETVIHSLDVKTHIATMKQDHPKLYLWAKSWKDGGEAKTESEEDKKDGAGPQPEAAIDLKECRLRLLEHIEDYQVKVDDRLTSIDAAISALEAEDPDVSSEVSDARMKQTMQMLLRDLTTLKEVATLHT